jgi:hypothetical protein
LRLVFGADDLVASYVGANLQQIMVPPYTAIGGTVDGETLCIGAVFNQWNGSNLDISLYGPGALRRGAIRAVYHYAFEQTGAQRLTAITRRSNKTMQRLLPRFGFQFEGTSKRFFGPSKADDGLRFVLFPEQARKWMT